MSDTRTIKLPDEYSANDAISKFIFLYQPSDNSLIWFRSHFAAALTEAARMGAKAAKEGKEVRYEP